MSKKAMKLALEALQTAEDFDIDADDGYYLKAIKALEEALAKQEPVAEPHKGEPVAKYIGECSEGSLVQLFEDVKKGTNFYTTPQPKQEQGEPFGWYDMEHGEIRDVEWNRLKPTYEGVWRPLYTTPQQRTWVGLTDEERFEVADHSDCFEDVVDAVEAKLKEKNG